MSTGRADTLPPFYVMELLAHAKKLEAEGRSILHLEVGEPDFSTPQPIIDAGIQALRQGRTSYTPTLGLLELREAIVLHYYERFGIKLDVNRVIITTGASGALLLALTVLLNNDDEVLLADPGYPCNQNIVKLLGAQPVAIPVNPGTQYQLTHEHIEQYWSKKTVAAMVASPSNPTGTLIKKTQLKLLLDSIESRQGRLIIDEIYQGLVYNKTPESALSISDNVVVINSFSKYFGMTGWRLGWMVVPEEMTELIDRAAQNMFLAAPTIAQYAALSAFKPATEEILQRRVSIFKERRDYLLPALREMGFKVHQQPEGAFYIYADCSEHAEDSQTWTYKLLEKEGVAITPGLDFGVNKAGSHVRFAYTRSVDELKKACCRIQRFIH